MLRTSQKVGSWSLKLNDLQEAATYPDWGKMEFYSYPPKDWAELLPKASERARDLVSKLVRYESRDRLSAVAAKEHPYLETSD